jgi:hypothetical protein
MKRARICLVTPGHLSSTPRLVKEANALHAAGADVRVVACDHYATVRPLDDSILAGSAWRSDRLPLEVRPAYFLRRLTQKFARRLIARIDRPTPRLALWAHQPHAFQLAAAAAREPADLYLGHCVAGLAAAGLAAQHRRALLGFDAEDFHRAEISDTPPREVVTLEDYWLPRSSHRTASSPLIAEAYAEACGVTGWTVVLNVFPLAEAPIEPKLPPVRPVLYWFSQTIGPGRGLEQLISVLGNVRTPCELHLRGLPVPGYPEELSRRASATGFRGKIICHALANPSDMVRLASQHTLGLSLEQRAPRNRNLCLTNKIFTYLLAGVPVLLTPTLAQSWLATKLGEAALCPNFTNAAESAAAIDAWLTSPSHHARAAARARQLGETRYNWDLEQHGFLSAIRSALSPKHR